MKESELFELRFDFEQARKCFFHSDQSAPLKWKTVEGESKNELKNQIGMYLICD